MTNYQAYKLILIAIAIYVWHCKEPTVVDIQVYPYASFWEE